MPILLSLLLAPILAAVGGVDPSLSVGIGLWVFAAVAPLSHGSKMIEGIRNYHNTVLMAAAEHAKRESV